MLAIMSGGRPKNHRDPVTIEFAASPKLADCLDTLKANEGYGNSRAEIARNFVWKEVNRLIEVERLKPN